ncbi:MAG: carboxypeptidase regulatory-like domain-containing protein [Planctomycetes bacterium]|nr:carboxypeptidase regulatory-like domain-containing protein [Planctomycetota bacterium]
MKARNLVGIVAVLALAAWFGWRGLRSAPVETASEPATLAPAETLRAQVELAEPTASAERTNERTVEAATRSEVKVEASSELQPADARLLVTVVAAEDGRALAGIRVSLRPEPHGPHSWKHLTSSVGDEKHPPLSDAQGVATLHVRADVAFTLIAERLTEPLAKVEVQVEALAKDELRDLRVELATAADVLYYGRALDADTRAPIAGAVVTSRTGGTPASDAPSVHSAADGIFAWPAHSSVPSNVRVEAPGYGPRFAFLDARYTTAEHALDVELTRGAAMVVRLVGERPPAVALRVRVTAERYELLQLDPSPDVRVFHVEGGEENWEADIDADGRAMFELLPSRIALAITVRAEKRELARHGKRVRLEPGETRELDVDLGAAGTIVGTLRDQHGAPIAGREVTLTESDAPDSRRRSSRTSPTDDSGGFVFTEVPLGSWRVGVASSAGPETGDDPNGVYGRAQEATLTAATPRAVVELVVARGVTIEGLVVDAAGAPVAGMHVLALDAEPSEQLGQDVLRRTETRADGTFSLSRVSTGEWRVWADASAGFAACEPVIAKGGDTGVRLVVTPGVSIEVTVLDETGARVEHGSLAISENGLEHGSVWVSGFDAGTRTVDGLRAGSWDLTATTQDGRIGCARVGLVAPAPGGDPQRFTITVRPGGTLELWVATAPTSFSVRHGEVRVAFDGVIPGTAARVVVPAGVSTIEWPSPATGATRTKDVRIEAGEKLELRLDED